MVFVAVLVGSAAGGLDAEVGRDATQHDGVDIAFAEHLVQSGLVERADSALHDLHVSRLRVELSGQLAALRLDVDTRALDPYVDDQSTHGPGRLRQCDAPLQYFPAGQRCRVQRDDARHQIDQDQRGTTGLQFESAHSLRL